jgi:ketopantoate hydroxymethyltransferase
VRRYADVGAVSVEALAAFADDVRSGRFPNDDESYHLSAEVSESLSLYGSPSAD